MTKILPTRTPAVSDGDAASTTSTLPYRPSQTTNNSDDATVEIHPLPDKEGLIIRVQPPQAPKDERLLHVPCDIVLVIDVSGSMSNEARLPSGSEDESTGLSVLDLVKHACRTILSTLNDGDRLAIITFSYKETVVQELTAMTDANKKTTEDNIKRMHIQGSTNLWAGLKKGITTLNCEMDTGRVPAVLVLTDGLPNFMCPPGGYVPALRALGDIIPTIHTFGFGYNLRSGLLKSVAEYGRGNYAFICDAGMIGTVFVHAVAHLQSTFATNATLRLKHSNRIALVQTAGSSIDEGKQGSKTVPGTMEQDNSLVLSLGNIQYGQSRDIFLRWKSTTGKDERRMEEIEVEATLEYGLITDSRKRTSTRSRLLSACTTDLTSAEIAYHISRHQTLEFLSSIFPIDALGEHRTSIPPTAPRPFSRKPTGKANSKKEEEQDDPPSEALTQTQQALRTLIATTPAANFPTDPLCASLMQDLTSPEPYGQISLALSKQSYFSLWGQHYLPSLHGAHARQLCNSFKDPGPLQYNTASPLFLACRNALNTAFDDLPPPEPGILPVPEEQGPRPKRLRRDPTRPDDTLNSSQEWSLMSYGRSYRPSKTMSEYNSRDNPCFGKHTMVALAGGKKTQISNLGPGVSVETPKGPREVAAVLLRPYVSGMSFVNLNGVVVTPWHPVMLPGGAEGGEAKWVFPCQASEKRTPYGGHIYSILLKEDPDVDAHAIKLSAGEVQDGTSFWGVTLGHGIESGSDLRAHPFFGNYDRVASNVKTLPEVKKGLFVTGGTFKRSEKVRTLRFFGDYDRVASNVKTLPEVKKEVFVTGGTVKRSETGLVIGFRRYSGFVGLSYLGLH